MAALLSTTGASVSPELVLGDEPIGALNAAMAAEIMDLLVRLNRENGITIVMVTHSPAYADYAHRVIHLFDGHIVTENLRAA